ncbi:hypothetical protein BGZ76_003217 [Entomortierella beljakovae]|nr:hypothetical protein BGZ76_003217 [Entomortierella beljakovae]
MPTAVPVLPEVTSYQPTLSKSSRKLSRLFNYSEHQHYHKEYQQLQQQQQQQSTSNAKLIECHECDDMVVLSLSTDLNKFKPSLHDVLTDQVGGLYSLENFAHFLQGQFCYENLAFWLASHQYKLSAISLSSSIKRTSPQFNLHQSSLQYLSRKQTRLFSDLQSEMLAILETFILPESSFEINLSDLIRSKLLKAVTDGDYHPQVLDQTRTSVFDLMKTSCFPLFLDHVSNREITLDSSSSSVSTFSQDDVYRERGSWKLKAKEHFKLVSKALKKTSL